MILIAPYSMPKHAKELTKEWIFWPKRDVHIFLLLSFSSVDIIIVNFFIVNFFIVDIFLVSTISNCIVLGPTIRLQQSTQGQTCHKCKIHDIVAGLCSELILKLIYNVHLVFGKNLSTRREPNQGLSACELSTLYLDQSAKSDQSSNIKLQQHF